MGARAAALAVRHVQPELEHGRDREHPGAVALLPVGVGNGLVANYFSDTELNKLALTRVDSTVNFDWGTTSPGAGVPSDLFSARWTGKIQAQHTETYTFYTESDEGVALWINGQQIIDNFSDHPLTEDAGTISLKAGELYDVRLEYYETAFDATMKLSWASPSTGVRSAAV